MRALVTGASSGIGAAIAVALAADGHEVIAAARRAERLEGLASRQPGIAPLALDVTDVDAMATTIEELGAIDVLVNNAGAALGLGPAQEASLEDWLTMIQVNVTGLVVLTRLVLPSMVARRSGLVVNMGSVAGEFPYPGGNVYGATKAFVRQFTLNLRADLVGTGVRVTDIEPGMVGGTEFSTVRFHGDTAKAAEVYQGMQPLGPDDVAEVVRFIASLPPHVSINTISLMPTDQGFGPFAVARRPLAP